MILVALPFASAQTTSIGDLKYPAEAPGGIDPIIVDVSVSYQGAMIDYSLVVGIVDPNSSPQQVIPGIPTATPGPCRNQPILAAICVMDPQSSSGIENLEFKIGGILDKIRNPGPWNLEMRAVLLDSANNAIHGSTSSVPFTILLTPLSLTITVPKQANVTVDGKNQPQHPVILSVIAGQHNVTVSQITELGNGTRLRFDHWTDGLQNATRTIFVDSDVVYEAIYVTQYRLVINGGINASESRWYDYGAVARFVVPTIAPMNGLLGALGGKLHFQGWYEDGNLVTKLANDTISMSEPHTLTAQWQADFTMPIEILTPIAIVVIVFAYFTTKRARRKRRARRSRSRASRSTRTRKT
jgi:hypothetical protein